MITRGNDGTLLDAVDPAGGCWNLRNATVIGVYLREVPNHDQPCEFDHPSCASWRHGPCSIELRAQLKTLGGA